MRRGYPETDLRAVLVLLEVVRPRTCLTWGQKVQPDSGVAILYDATTGRFNEQTRRNVERLAQVLPFALHRDGRV